MGPVVDVMVFDSGVGGLSVLAAIRAHAPSLSTCYVADSEGLPYGGKSEEWLLDRVPRIIDDVMSRLQCSILVIACNTASTIILPMLRSRLSIPVVGVVPAIKPAAETTRNGRIGLLATPATVQRPYTDELIREFAGTCVVERLGSSRLVAIAEDKLRGKAVDLGELAAITSPLMAKDPDTVVLGCTHFPLLSEELRTLYPSVSWLDSGTAIARRVLQLHGEKQTPKSPADGTAFVTRDDIDVNNLREFGIKQIIPLKIPAGPFDPGS